MRSLFTSRLFRCVVSLLLICCVLVQISPLKVRATSAVVPIVKAATVTGNPYVIVGAALIALGVMVGTETGAFETVVDNAVSFLDTAGGWIEDGTMQLLQTVDSTGQSMYYAAGDLFETLRSWIFDSGTVVITDMYVPSSLKKTLLANIDSFVESYSTCYVLFEIHASEPTTKWMYLSKNPFTLDADGYYRSYSASGSFGTFQTHNIVGNSWRSSHSNLSKVDPGNNYILYSDSSLSNLMISDLSLGVLHSTALDGDTYDDAYADYMRKQLRVINSGGDGGSGEDPDNGGGNNWKWYLPLALAGTAAATYGTTQLQQWTGVSMTDYQVTGEIKEFEILDTPEIDGYQGLEISPASGGEAGGDSGSDSGEDTDPTTGSDPDTGGSSNPDSGSDSDPDTNPDADPDTNPDTDPDAGTDTGTDAWSPSGDMQHFTLDLKDYFPFCIPFDLYDFFTCLNADPVAPVIEWVIPLPGGETYPLELDLAVFDDVAQLLRRLQLLLFCVGLAFKTRDLIKG